MGRGEAIGFAPPVSTQNEETAAQLASRFGVHPTMISSWKRQLLDGAAELFDRLLSF